MIRWLASNFQHTTNSEQKGAGENGLKAVENGGRGQNLVKFGAPFLQRLSYFWLVGVPIIDRCRGVVRMVQYPHQRCPVYTHPTDLGCDRPA